VGTPASGRGLNQFRIFTGATAGVAALILLLTQVVGGNGPGEQDTGGQAEEIRLEPISYTPPDAFTQPLTPETPPPSPSPSPISTPTPTTPPGDTGVDLPLSGTALLPVDPASSGAVRSASADTVGLYGGSLRYSRCARGRLVDFLSASPAKARAWISVLNSDPTLYWSGGSRLTVDDIRSYVFELTPVVLRTDTWVTNHGFSNGRATPIQSVLQAGTAVLVDAYGVPRLKCYCGNPLLPPRRFRPVYRGPRWPGFDPTRVIIVTRSVTIIDTFTLYDVATGALFARRPGTEGDEDAPRGGEPTVGPTGGPELTVPPDIELGSGDVQVTLIWTNGADLDLHVVDPQGSEIYFGQPTSASGGEIDHDDTAGCGTSGSHVENIFWPSGGAPSGGYEAYVDNFGGCDGSASFRLRITVRGAVVYDDDGLLAEDEPMTPVTFTV
jgi:hypothetical protein